MGVKPIPDGYHSITPYLIVNGAAAAIEFYKRAFGAEELFRMPMPDGGSGMRRSKWAIQSLCWPMNLTTNSTSKWDTRLRNLFKELL